MTKRTPPREDEFFHSKTLGDRYVSKGVRAGDRRGDRQSARVGRGRQSPRRRHPQPGAAPRRSAGRCVRVLCRLPHPHRRRPRRAVGAEETQLAATHRRHHHRRDRQPGRGAAPRRAPHRRHAVEALSCTAQLLRLVFDEHGAIRSYQLMPASVTDALFGRGA